MAAVEGKKSVPLRPPAPQTLRTPAETGPTDRPPSLTFCLSADLCHGVSSEDLYCRDDSELVFSVIGCDGERLQPKPGFPHFSQTIISQNPTKPPT